MAMIQCPNCREMISDKAKRCIHCNFELIPEEKKLCAECGAELERSETVCPKCGCPVEEMEKNTELIVPQPVEVTAVKITKKSKKFFGIIIAVVVAIIVAALGIQNLQKQKEQEEYAKEQEEYASNLKLVTKTMLSGAAEAETCGSLIQQVWSNAIYEKRDPVTDKYTRPDGYFFVSDFNRAISNLFNDADFKKKIEKIKSNQSTVQTLMKNLTNPPKEYEDAYAKLSEFYNAYTELTNLAISPTGNLQTFSSNFNDADSETYNKYSALEVYIN